MSTAIKPRQLNLDELRLLKWLLGGAVALVSLWTIFFLDVEAVGLVAVAGAIILTALIWPPLSGRVPGVLWKLAVPGIIVAVGVDYYFSPDTLPVLIRLAVLLVLYRAVAYRRKREDLQLIVLGMFLIVVAGVLTVSLGFAFLLLLFTACSLGFLFVINLVDASETGLAQPAITEIAWTRVSWLKLFSRLHAVADWRMLGFASGLFVTVVVMSGLLFLVIPRFEFASGFFLDKYITRKSRTGFTESVKFGEVTELTRDESVAMRVDIEDPRSLRETPYWRLVVLDEYTPTGFRMSSGLKSELIRNQRMTQHSSDPGAGRIFNSVGGVWSFYIEPGVSRFLPLPGSYGQLRLSGYMMLQKSAGHRLAALQTEAMKMTAFQLEDVGMTSIVPDTEFAKRLQRVRDNPRGRTEKELDDPLLCLRGPQGPANVTVLDRVAREIDGGTKRSADEFARRTVDWLRAHHTYALSAKLPAGPGRDDVVRWVDSNEPGFCEYFAAGFAVLARAAGYPTRVIVGFHGGILNAFENYYMVRNADAHAWVEIYDGVNGWQRFDPTPGTSTASVENAIAAVEQEQDSSWSARWDSLRVLWYRRIVNFDSRTQVQMLEQVKTFTTDSTQALHARFDALTRRLKAWAKQPWDAARIRRVSIVVISSTGVGTAFIWLCYRGWRRWQRWRRPEEFDPVRRSAGKWLGQLRAEGKRGELASPGVVPDRAVVDDLQRLRYGPRETWPEPTTVFRRARQARKALRR